MLDNQERASTEQVPQKLSEQDIALVKSMRKGGGSKRALSSIHCPVELAIRIIGGKWKPVIIWRLRESKKRFGELKREIKGITVKMLAQQLRELEHDGLIDRKMYYEVPPRVEYSLTDLGRTLEPALRELAHWGRSYQSMLVSSAMKKAEEHVSDVSPIETGLEAAGK